MQGQGNDVQLIEGGSSDLRRGCVFLKIPGFQNRTGAALAVPAGLVVAPVTWRVVMKYQDVYFR